MPSTTLAAKIIVPGSGLRKRSIRYLRCWLARTPSPVTTNDTPVYTPRDRNVFVIDHVIARMPFEPFVRLSPPHARAAVARQGHARDEVGLVGSKEQRGVGAAPAGAHLPAQRHLPVAL